MFSATVEAALLRFGEPTIEDRLEGSVRRMLQRARRYAEIQERLITSDESFPAIGRSITIVTQTDGLP